ncbi:MAG: HNH endonuclease [Acidimicrobiia bacterium]
MTPFPRAVLVGFLAVGSWTLSACGATPDVSTPVGAQPIVTPSIYPLLPPTTEDPGSDAEDDHSVSMTRNAEDVVVPNPQLTPGDAFDDVDEWDICDLHYTQGVRQPRFNAKVAAFASYGVSIRDRDVYQVDHLIPLSLGGSNEETNLWPQPYDDQAGAEQKDQLERQLRGLVCSNAMTLLAAQQAITRDWWLAYQTYMLLPIEVGSAGPEPWRPPPQEEGAVVNGGPCEVEGEIGYTDPKQIRLICTATATGELRWQKRG